MSLGKFGTKTCARTTSELLTQCGYRVQTVLGAKLANKSIYSTH